MSDEGIGVRSYFLKNKFTFGLLLVISSILFVVLVVSLIFLLDSFKKSEYESRVSEEYHQYRLLRVNNNNDQDDEGKEPDMSLGYVSIRKELEFEEFVSFKDSEGSDNLIFHFGNEPYRCFGSCVCVDEENESLKRRTSTASSTTRVLTRGLTYLVAVLTASSAYDLAKEYFSEECEEDYFESSSCSIFESQVESCFSLNSEEEVESESSSTTTTKFSNSNNNHIHTFQCEGKCDLHYRTYREELEEITEHIQLMNIENDHLEGAVDFDTGEDMGDGSVELFFEPSHDELKDTCQMHSLAVRVRLEKSDFEGISGVTMEKFELERMAKMKFLEKSLNPFCKGVRLGRDILPLIWDLEILAPGITRESGELRGLFDKFRICTPFPYDKLRYKELLDNIKCN